jgi:hypothetical protein
MSFIGGRTIGESHSLMAVLQLIKLFIDGSMVVEKVTGGRTVVQTGTLQIGKDRTFQMGEEEEQEEHSELEKE